MDHKVKELSVGNGPSGKSILTWQWIPSEGSVSSIDSLASIEARFSSTESQCTESQCSNSQKHANKVLRSESPLWLDEESALELRQVGSSVPERRIDSHGITKQKQLHRIPDMQEHGGVSYEELQSSCVKLMCSFGGKIMPRPSDGKLRYVSGETRIVSVKREIHYSELKSKLRELYVQDLCIKYQLPGEDLDALVSVSSDEDLENMMEEYDRLNASDSNLRLRVFLFSVYDNERASYIDSIGDFRAAENLYVDAVNGLLGSCSEKTMEMVALGDGYSPWESAESAVFSPSHPLRAYDQGLVVQRMVSSQTVSNPSSAPQSAPSSPSFLSRPMMMNRAVLDPPRQNRYDPQMKLKTYSCENAPLEMTNQDDGFSSSASSSNKDLHFQASESRKSPNYAGSLYHEIRPANLLHSVHTQGDQREEMMSKVISPRKFSNSHEQQLGYRPLVDSFSDFHPVQSLANSQPELQRRFHPQEFPPSGVSLENQCCLDETLSPRVFHSYGKLSRLEEKPKGPQMQANSGLGYPQGLDWSIQQDVCAGVCSYGEVGDFWYPQGDFKQLPEQILPQIVFEKPFMHQPELSKLQHDGGQGQSVQGRPEHFPQNGFQEHYCQNSEMCPFHFHKLQSFVEKQPHQDDFCRCHCKLYDPSSHVVGNESSCKFGPSCTCGLGSAPSSPRPSYHDISDRQTRLRLPAQWKHNGALYSDQQFCLRSHASINQQSTTPFQMSASPPLYAETEKLKECKVCRRHFRFTSEFGVEKQNPNFLPLLCEESFVCEGCYPSLHCKSPGCHTVHCFLQPNTNSYHREKVLSNHAGEQVPASESHIDLSGRRRDWPFQQKVATDKDEPRMVDRLYQNPNSHQERSVNERVENIQKELSGNMLVSNLGTFVDCASENGHHQVPRRSHLHETSAVPSKFTPYGLNAPARQSTVANKPIIVNGAESCELFPKTIETDSWSGVLISGHESTLQEPEDVVDTFDTHSHEQILSASTNIFSQMPSQGALKLDSAHCQHQQDLPNHRIKLGKFHIPMLPCSAEFSSYSDLADYPTSKEDEHHEGTLGRVASIKIDSANMDDCNGTCSTEELNPTVLQPEGPFFQSDDSLKLLASMTISSGQQLTRGWGDNAPTKIACSENNPIVTANTTDSLLSTGANHLLTNPSLLATKIPVDSTSTGEVNCLSNFPERNSIENHLEPFTSPEIHAADDNVKCESFTLVPSFVPEKKTTEVQLFANKALAEDCAFFVLGSNGSQETCGFNEEETLQAGCLVKVDEGARDQVLSQDQSNLLEMPTFSIQAWEEALESVAVTKSQADSEEQCDVTKSQVDSEEQCDKLAGVAEPFVENPLPTEEENVEVFKSEPAQERTNSDTCCSSVETASAAATKAIAGGLQTVKNSDLEEIRELGSGNFGTVYHGKWRGSDVAIKRIKASFFSGRSSEQERLLADFWKEANTLSQLHHPNVVAFYGVVPDGPGGTLATVTEFMVNGSLKQVLQKKDRTIDRRKRVLIAMDAAFGMEYLHGKNIVHFDLKCENLLVNMRDPHRPICKVGDLGLSKVKQQTMVSGGIRGTLPWMAPELLSGNSSMVTEKVDVFSFGIVMWELLTGEEPYANMHYGAIIGGIVNNTLRPPVPNWCDPAWKSLMERCWAADPVRPSFADIVNELRTMTESLQPKHQRPVRTVRL